VHDNHKDHLLHHVMTTSIIHVLLLLDVVIYCILISYVATIFSSIVLVLSCFPYVV
jgi:hypothetical protein